MPPAPSTMELRRIRLIPASRLRLRIPRIPAALGFLAIRRMDRTGGAHWLDFSRPSPLETAISWCLEPEKVRTTQWLCGSGMRGELDRQETISQRVSTETLQPQSP